MTPAIWRNEPPPCVQCGGPHPFDTSIPSPTWNAVIRAANLPDYLCLPCIVAAFIAAGEGFTATLWSDTFNGTPIEVVIGGKRSSDAERLSEENTRLRIRVRELELRADALAPPEPLEICICAAIQFADGRIVRGHRHDSCFRTAEGWTPKPPREHVQGFITSRNRFVDRHEGARLQNEAGLISAMTCHAIEGYSLFSEDLYFDKHDEKEKK